MNVFPLISPDRDKPPEEPGRSLPVSATPGTAPLADELINILLVDDEPRNLTVLETILANPGYRLVRAESADQALLALVGEEFAVIVLDIQMPGMSGFELAQMIKQRKKTSAVPIIFLTAYYSEDQHVLEGYGTGAVDYLHKPVNATILRCKVAVFADLHRKTRETALANRALLAEVTERRRVQEEMRQLNNDLEYRVAERTSELLEANAALQQVELELKENDRRKDQFLAMLGHELRNPLAPIRNAVSILRQLGLDHADLNWCRDVLDRQSEHLTRLVDDLLDVSRVSRGKIQLDKENVDITVAAQQAVESCRPIINARRHELTLTLSRVPVHVHGDITRLAQVISNLINNAAKYTDEGGRIWLAVERADGDDRHAVIRVKDNGCGLDAAAIASLFELFYQVEGNLDRSDGGLGVGLALVRSIVELHGGTVEARSEGRGRGSEFIVRLPLAAETAVPESGAPPVPDKSAVTAMRILVVDDNHDAARSLAMLLKILGHEVLMAHDGNAAVAVALQERPDVVLLDIGLPGLDGYQACRSMRRQGMTSELIVALTGYGLEKDRQLAEEAGFDAHMVKPVDMPALLQLLATRADKL